MTIKEAFDAMINDIEVIGRNKQIRKELKNEFGDTHEWYIISVHGDETVTLCSTYHRIIAGVPCADIKCSLATKTK